MPMVIVDSVVVTVNRRLQEAEHRVHPVLLGGSGHRRSAASP